MNTHSKILAVIAITTMISPVYNVEAKMASAAASTALYSEVDTRQATVWRSTLGSQNVSASNVEQIWQRFLVMRAEHPTVVALQQMIESGHDLQRAAAVDAIAFFDSIPTDMPYPFVTSTESGLVTLEWQQGDIYAHVEFEGDGTCYVYCRDIQQAAGVGIEGVKVGREMDLVAERILQPLMIEQAWDQPPLVI